MSGAAWVRKALCIEPSPFGAKVADLLDIVFDGIYHLPTKSLRRVDWRHAEWMELLWSGTIATCDPSHLTRLVVLAHDACIRVEITPRSQTNLCVMFHVRHRIGGMFDRHPTIEESVASARSLAKQRQEQGTP